ncbi:hypothetical protein FC650_19315 [Vibrio natriegens]|uniref:hypothetical protein n=1 Tax=Vibrio natriegens TaxID=691 RepID=UPI00159359D8|nr:hypothetical protein [Vibrio natriegens]NVC95731.1 hypothetical protein [Vibrio natriegens]
MQFPDKLRYVQILYSNNYEIYFQGMLLPFLTSMAYLFVFTYPAEWVYRFSLGRQKQLNDLKNEKQANELLTLEQSKAIRNQLAEAEKQFEEQIERKDRAIGLRDKEIEKLTQEIVMLKSIDETSQSESIDKDGEAFKGETKHEFGMDDEKLKEIICTTVDDEPTTENEFMITILRVLANIPNLQTLSQIVSHFAQEDGGKAKLYLDELVQNNIITELNGYYGLPHDIRKMVLSDS